MRNQPARRRAGSVRKVSRKLQWRVYGLGWISSKAMVTLATLAAIIVILIVLIILLGF